MKKFFKFILSSLLAVLIIGTYAGCQNADSSKNGANKKGTGSVSQNGNSSVPKVVNIGVQTLVTPELITRYEKKYEEFLGTKVNLVQFDSGADVNKAFSSGSIDFGMFGSSPASLGIVNDIGIEVIWYNDVIGSAESLVATKKSGAKTIADLKGKKVATPFASTAHYSLLNALKQEGISSKDVELLDMQPEDIYASWNRGDIDAAYVWNPVLGQISKDATVITNSEQLAQKGIVTADVTAVRKEFADQYPDLVTNFIKAQIYGVETFGSNFETAIKEIASIAGIDEKEAKDQVTQFKYPTAKEQTGSDYLGTKDAVGNLAQILKDTADFHVEQGTINQAPELEKFKSAITGEFVEKALASK